MKYLYCLEFMNNPKDVDCYLQSCTSSPVSLAVDRTWNRACASATSTPPWKWIRLAAAAMMFPYNNTQNSFLLTQQCTISIDFIAINTNILCIFYHEFIRSVMHYNEIILKNLHIFQTGKLSRKTRLYWKTLIFFS